MSLIEFSISQELLALVNLKLIRMLKLPKNNKWKNKWTHLAIQVEYWLKFLHLAYEYMINAPNQSIHANS